MIKVGQLGIKPAGNLQETASILGSILGGLVFRENASGFYEEFPAFEAEYEGTKYVLLGVPAPEYDMRDEPSDDFELQIEPITWDSGERIDISGQVAAIISSDGRIACWLLD
jgi:hypothetical protein